MYSLLSFYDKTCLGLISRIEVVCISKPIAQKVYRYVITDIIFYIYKCTFIK